jgi:hypothetical protein
MTGLQRTFPRQIGVSLTRIRSRYIYFVRSQLSVFVACGNGLRITRTFPLCVGQAPPYDCSDSVC